LREEEKAEEGKLSEIVFTGRKLINLLSVMSFGKHSVKETGI
jgi:hypothetical protein